MASRYDSHDPRPRRDESKARSTTSNTSASHLRPEATVEASNGKVRRGDERLDTGRGDARGRDHSRARSTHSKSRHSSLLQADAAVSRPSRSRSRRPVVRAPPPPICEDEAVSLGKEAGSRDLLKDIGRDEAVSRGAVDQEPIVDEIQKPITKQHDASSTQRQPGKSSSKHSSIPTPPTSDDEVSRRADRRPSKLSMNLGGLKKDDVPELGKRAASPYAFSKEQGLAKDEKAKARFLSPDAFLTPPVQEVTGRSGKRPLSKSQPNSPTREPSPRDSKSSPGNDYFTMPSNENAIDDADYDPNDTNSRSNRNKSSTFPPTRRDSSNINAQTNTKDFAQSASLAPPRRRNLDARRNTDSEGTMPTLPRLHMDKTRRPTPLMTTTALSGLQDATIYASPTMHKSALDVPLPASRNPSHPSSRNVSPANSASGQQRNPTPPETPRASSEILRQSSINSSPASRPGSASESRPSSPSPRTPLDASRFPKTDLDWSTVMAANAARRSQPPPRVSAIRQETMPPFPRDAFNQFPAPGPAPVPAPASRNSSLPYPVDDGPLTPSAWMPAEHHHQYFPEPRPITQAPLMQEPKALPHTYSPPVETVPSGYPRHSRPSMPVRHSTSDVPTMERQIPAEKPTPPEKSRSTESKRISSFNNPSQAKKDLPLLIKKGLPDCPRPKPVAGYSDWYCLASTPTLDFCPDCIDHLGRSSFRLSFRRSPPRNSSKKVVCALGGEPWIQLAWLLTIHHERVNVALLEDMARIDETTDPCPGDDHHAPRSWYGLKDRDGYYVQNFGICYNDVRKLEALMPSLSNIFVPLPRRMSLEKTICAMRIDGNRFDTYFDALLKAHEDALTHRRSAADPNAFIDLVKKRQRLRECAKDRLYHGHLWHFIPNVLDFTVCEDCFETIIEPEVRKNKDVAMRFNRTLQPVHGDKLGVGVSCQLYSPRMRKVFARAVAENDVRYLTRKARERREAEVRLQERYAALTARMRRLSRDVSGSSKDGRDARDGAGYEGEEEGRRLEREMKRVFEEWQSWE